VSASATASASIRCGASNSTCVDAAAASASNACLRSAPRAGRKPTKVQGACEACAASPPRSTRRTALLAPGSAARDDPRHAPQRPAPRPGR
jgi:hypothetical protein